MPSCKEVNYRHGKVCFSPEPKAKRPLSQQAIPAKKHFLASQHIKLLGRRPSSQQNILVAQFQKANKDNETLPCHKISSRKYVLTVMCLCVCVCGFTLYVIQDMFHRFDRLIFAHQINLLSLENVDSAHTFLMDNGAQSCLLWRLKYIRPGLCRIQYDTNIVYLK